MMELSLFSIAWNSWLLGLSIDVAEAWCVGRASEEDSVVITEREGNNEELRQCLLWCKKDEEE